MRIWSTGVLLGPLAASALGWALAPAASAAPGRVVLIAPDARLERAVAVALEPWHIAVVAVSAADAGLPSSPASELPADTMKVRVPDVARRARAGAVVWIARDGLDPALWLYDADTGQSVRIKLESRPPFDDPTAAAVALTIKTLLRHSALAPAEERIALSAPPSPMSGPAQLGLEVVARARAVGALALEPRLGIGASWDPGPTLGLVAHVELGPGVAVDDPTFAGRFDDLAAGAGASARLRLGRVVLGAAAGAALHYTGIDGVTQPDGIRVTVHRVNPTVDGSAGIGVAIGARIQLGARLAGSLALRRQRYLIGPRAVLSLPMAEAGAGVFASVALW